MLFYCQCYECDPRETAAAAQTTPTSERMLPGIKEPVDQIISYFPDLISGSLFLMSPCNDFRSCRPSPSNASVWSGFSSPEEEILAPG